MSAGRSRVRAGRRVRRQWSILAVLLVAAPAGCGGIEDQELVRCLAPTNRAAMVDAAVALGVAKAAPGGSQVLVGTTPTSLEEWRTKQSDGFERTCAALPPAGGGGGGESSPWIAAIFALLAAIVGAIAAAATTAHLAGAGRRRLAANQVSTLADALRQESAAYVAGWRDTAPKRDPSAAVAARRRLEDALRAIAIEHPQWVLAEEIRLALEASLLTDDLTPGTREPPARAKLLDDLEAQIDRAVRGTGRLATAIRRPERHPLRLRRALPD